MLCGFALALAVGLAAQDPASVSGGASATSATLTLELRVFDGVEEVTSQTRLTVHRAGERRESIPHARVEDARVQLKVPPGIYDVQAIHERDGRVINIRWANRLVVMPYPDERGHHLEVINFRNGFGALQVRAASGAPPEAAIYEQGKRAKPAGTGLQGPEYVLFVVPAGTYDVQARKGGKLSWTAGVEVPLDRTRLSIIE
jgi:hypothetical protein